MKNEPAAIGAFAAAMLAAVTTFADLGLSGDEQGAIVTVIILVAGFFVRAKVTPVA